MEKTIPKPLSGSEVVESIVQKIKAQLGRDCFLTPHLAYQSFSFQAEIRVQFQRTDTAIKDTIVRSHGQGGEVDPETDMESVDVTVSGEPQPPNQVRIEAGLGVPAIATKPTGGVEEKRLKYAQQGAPATTAKSALEQGNNNPPQRRGRSSSNR